MILEVVYVCSQTSLVCQNAYIRQFPIIYLLFFAVKQNLVLWLKVVINMYGLCLVYASSLIPTHPKEVNRTAVISSLQMCKLQLRPGYSTAHIGSGRTEFKTQAD